MIKLAHQKVQNKINKITDRAIDYLKMNEQSVEKCKKQSISWKIRIKQMKLYQ